MKVLYKWAASLVLLIALVLSGCSLGSPFTGPSGPGNGPNPGQPNQQSASISFELLDLDDVESIQVTMMLQHDAPIGTVPVRTENLTIDRVQKVATGNVLYLREGTWDFTVQATMQSGPTRSATTSVYVSDTAQLILQGTLAPDPNNPTGLVIAFK